MTEIKKKAKEKATCVYVPPRIEVHEVAPGRLMGTSFYGEADMGDNKDHDLSEHERGTDGNVQYGAKAVILGQEFNFSNPWED